MKKATRKEASLVSLMGVPPKFAGILNHMAKVHHAHVKRHGRCPDGKVALRELKKLGIHKWTSAERIKLVDVLMEFQARLQALRN